MSTAHQRDDARRDFENREVVVTGGTGALGRAVIDRLLARGAICHVPVFDRDELEGFAHRDHDDVRLVLESDLGDPDTVRRIYEGVDAPWASIHCAGGFAMSGVVETSAADLESQWRLNAKTAFLCCREAIRRMRAKGGGGRLVNVAARPALEPRTGAGMVAYTMAKSAVAALTVALAEEVAAEDIWVNAVAPSILDTPGNRAAMPDADPNQWAPLPAVAESIVFLASPRNGATRGGLVPVYGRT